MVTSTVGINGRPPILFPSHHLQPHQRFLARMPLLHGPTNRTPPGHASQHQSYYTADHIDLIWHLGIQIESLFEQHHLRRVIPDHTAVDLHTTLHPFQDPQHMQRVCLAPPLLYATQFASSRNAPSTSWAFSAAAGSFRMNAYPGRNLNNV